MKSLYTNIDIEEGAEACFKYLENTLFVLKSNIFCFGINLYHQIKGIATLTFIAPNYANFFMASPKEKIINNTFETIYICISLVSKA